jgi:Domain of unknown function (DUF4124)
MRALSRFCVLLAAGVLLHAFVHAQVYRWADKEGRVHFTDRKPDERTPGVETVNVPTAAAVPDTEQQQQRERGRKLLQVWEAERVARENAAADMARERAERGERCAWIANEVARMDRARVLSKKGEDGSRQYMSDNERDQYVRQLEEWRDRNCY